MFIAALTLATTTPLIEPEAKCLAAAVSDADYGECYGAAIEHADAELNSRWKKIMAAVTNYGPEVRQNLIAEERAWIAFKEAACLFYYGEGNGTMHRFIAAPQCRLQIIQSRIADLNTIIGYLNPEDAH